MAGNRVHTGSTGTAVPFPELSKKNACGLQSALMRTWRVLLVVLVAFSVSCRFWRRPPAGNNGEEAKVERGRLLYVANCAPCHGHFGFDGRAPDLYRSALVARDKSGDVIAPVIRAGRPGVGMPSFAFLTDAQIGDLTGFLDRTASDVRGSGPKMQQMVTGNPVEGKAYFAAKCSACHSATGDLAGVATRLSPLDLQNRLLYPTDGAGKTATVTQSDGGKFTGAVVYEDEFNVAITGTDGRYHSWLRDDITADIHDPLDGHRALLAQYTNSDVHNVFAYLSTLK
jgi:cytochrome c oxidase cbb3-type subunit 3